MEAGWPTPDAKSGEGGEYQNSEKVVKRIEAGHQILLEDQVRLAGWGTPRVGNNAGYGNEERGKRGDNCRLEDQAQMTHGLISNGSHAPMANIGVLNPEFARWLMGFPADWGSCAPTGTRSASRLP
jgi:hypothetical protein